jgi:hypothetical protein
MNSVCHRDISRLSFFMLSNKTDQRLNHSCLSDYFMVEEML